MSRLDAPQTLKIYVIVLIWSAFVFWAGFTFGTREREVEANVEPASPSLNLAQAVVPWEEPRREKELEPPFPLDSTATEPGPGETAPSSPQEEADQPAGGSAQVVPAPPVLSRDFHTVQVAAFKSEEECLSLLDRLRANGHEPRLVRPAGAGGLFRIWVGQFDTKDEAEVLEETLKKQGFSTYVRVCPPLSAE